jgi:hypothetical protein
LKWEEEQIRKENDSIKIWEWISSGELMDGNEHDQIDMDGMAGIEEVLIGTNERMLEFGGERGEL